MPSLFTEVTCVQLTAVQHLARIGYMYLDKISEAGVVPYAPETKLKNRIALSKKMNLKLEAIVRVIFDKQMKLGEKSNRHAKLRDKLLPLLMNGQVTVA